MNFKFEAIFPRPFPHSHLHFLVSLSLSRGHWVRPWFSGRRRAKGVGSMVRVCHMASKNIYICMFKNLTWKWHTKEGSIFFREKKLFSHMHLRDWLNLIRIKMGKRWDFWWTEVTFAREKLTSFFPFFSSFIPYIPLWKFYTTF